MVFEARVNTGSELKWLRTNHGSRPPEQVFLVKKTPMKKVQL